MTNFLSKFFGKGKKSEGASDAQGILQETLEQVFELADLDLSFNIEEQEEVLKVELSGADEEALRDRDGQLLDSLQFFSKRVLQHKLPETKVEVVFDTNGYREESSQALIDLADKLKSIVLEKNKSVYFRALPPKDRKVIHQHLAGDDRVKSRSVGEGLYKKIKIFPASQAGRRNKNSDHSADVSEA